MSEETKKTPCMEAASFFHGITDSLFLPPSLGKLPPVLAYGELIPMFCLMWQCCGSTFKDVCVAWLSRDSTKVLWKAEPADHVAESIKKVGCKHLGMLFSALARLSGGAQVFSCFLHAERLILIIKHSTNMEKVTYAFLGVELSRAGGRAGWDNGWRRCPDSQKESVAQMPILLMLWLHYVCSLPHRLINPWNSPIFE